MTKTTAPTGEEPTSEVLAFRKVAEEVVAPKLRQVLKTSDDPEKSPVIILVGTADGQINSMMNGDASILYAMLVASSNRLKAQALREEYKRLMGEEISE